MKLVALFAVSLSFACGGSGGKKMQADLSATVADMTPVVFDGGSTGLGTGPGAGFVCETSGKNAFSTYGATTLVEINEQIFANIRASLATGPLYLGQSLELVPDMSTATVDSNAVFKAKFAAYLVWAFGGPSSFQYTDGVTYVGAQDMAAAHKGLGITEAQYNYFVSNDIVPALIAVGIPSGAGDSGNDVSSCFAPLFDNPAFIASIVTP